MRRITLISAVLAFTVFSLQAQIIPEYTFSGVSASYINLPVEGHKFYIMDVANNQCRLYNEDHSLWKTVYLSVPANYYLCDIQYVTEDLFNADNTIELLYVSCNFNTTAGYYTYSTRIANENGTVLLDVPGGGYSMVYPAYSGSKLFVWVYDYSLANYLLSTKIYSIPGQITTAMKGLENAEPALLKAAFPNPASTVVTIPYTLPQNVTQAELKLYGISGNLVKTFTIDHSFDTVTVPTQDLSVGTYLYRIESGKYRSDSFKLIVNR